MIGEVITHKTMKVLTWKKSLFVIGVIYIIPIVLCAIFKISDLGSIGPTVIIYSLSSLPLFIYIYIKSPLQISHLQLSAIVGAVFTGMSSTILLNFFMLLTYLFNIHDYQAM